MSITPPVPGHLHTLDLPTSGIDDEPLAPTAVSRERSAQGPKTPGDEAAGLSTPKYETSISLNSNSELALPTRAVPVPVYSEFRPNTSDDDCNLRRWAL